MKRMTETDKWRDSWFVELEPIDKLLWIYILDNCNNAGVFDASWKTISFMMGAQISAEYFDKVFSCKLFKISCTKYWVRNFIKIQYGELSGASFPHKSVLRNLREVGFCDFDIIKSGSKEIYSNIVNAFPVVVSENTCVCNSRLPSTLPTTLLSRLPSSPQEEEEEEDKEKKKKKKKTAVEKTPQVLPFFDFDDESIKSLVGKISPLTQSILSSKYSDRDWVKDELHKMLIWIDSEPVKGKKKKWGSFVSGWLERGSKRSGVAKGFPSIKSTEYTDSDVEKIEKFLSEAKAESELEDMGGQNG